ncbi:MAG: nucleotidyltransferase domain-containing protein [Saprospiraceae bacterium]|nr:nucleotidyltransferase domain-containing protein [Saprospiraceae bacterium]
MNSFGITKKSYKLLLDLFLNHPQIEQVILYGSRAKGNFKKGSDIDLAIKGKDCNAEIATRVKSTINEVLPIPYKVDIVDYESLMIVELKQKIDEAGVVFYERITLVSLEQDNPLDKSQGI